MFTARAPIDIVFVKASRGCLFAACLLTATACGGWPGTTELPTCNGVEPELPPEERPRAVAAVTEAWPQWRGPGRDGVASSTALPAELPDNVRQVWCVNVGEGHASPLVDGERIFLHSREGEQEVVRALSLRAGETMWQRAYPVPYQVTPAAIDVGPGPKATPALADGRLFTFGISETLSAWSASSGELLWRRDFSDRFGQTSPLYGTASSPLVVDDSVVVHVGGENDGALMAFDVATGQPRWAAQDLPPGYSSPVVFYVAGRRQIVTQSRRRIVGVGADSGVIEWEIPFVTSMDQNIITPVVLGDRLVLSGLDNGVFAIGFDGPDPVEVWRNSEFPMRITTPVVVGDRLFGMSHRRRGQFFCLDADTGEAIWSSGGRESDLSSAVIALGDRIAFLTHEARLIFVSANADEYEPLAEYEVADSQTWAHPVFVPGGVLVKGVNTLHYWSF